MKPSAAALAATLLLAAAAQAADFWALDSGNWSGLTWYTDGAKTTVQPGAPGASDNVVVGSVTQTSKTVVYDLDGTNDFASVTVQYSSTLAWKTTAGVADVRCMRVAGNVRIGIKSVSDYARLVIGGSEGGAATEAADQLALLFTSAGGALITGAVSGEKSERTSLHVEGFSPTVRNAEIAGTGGVYGAINFQGGRRGVVLQNANLHHLTGIAVFRDGAEARTGVITGCRFADFSGNATSYMLQPGGVDTIDGNVFENPPGHGVLGVASNGKFVNNTLSRTTRGGNGLDFPSYPGSGQLVTNNTFSGFDRGINEIWRLYNLRLAANRFSNCNVGLRWTNSGGGNAVSFRSEQDRFGAPTANAVYDLYLADLNNGDGVFNLDGSTLASDADPLQEFYFGFRTTLRKTAVAWRDFNGVVGDYRVWSGTLTMLWSDILFPPRTTDTLRLANQTAYSAATPTRLTLTQDAEVGDLLLDGGTTLVLGGYNLKINNRRHALDGTVDDSGGGSLIWKDDGGTRVLLR